MILLMRIKIMQHYVLYCFTIGFVRALSCVEDDIPYNRFNDAKCDRLSRLWCGTMDGGSVTIPNFPRTKGSLYCYVVNSEYIVVVYVIYKSASEQEQ